MCSAEFEAIARSMELLRRSFGVLERRPGDVAEQHAAEPAPQPPPNNLSPQPAAGTGEGTEAVAGVDGQAAIPMETALERKRRLGRERAAKFRRRQKEVLAAAGILGRRPGDIAEQLEQQAAEPAPQTLPNNVLPQPAAGTGEGTEAVHYVAGVDGRAVLPTETTLERERLLGREVGTRARQWQKAATRIPERRPGEIAEQRAAEPAPQTLPNNVVPQPAAGAGEGTEAVPGVARVAGVDRRAAVRTETALERESRKRRLKAERSARVRRQQKELLAVNDRILERLPGDIAEQLRQHAAEPAHQTPQNNVVQQQAAGTGYTGEGTEAVAGVEGRAATSTETAEERRRRQGIEARVRFRRRQKEQLAAASWLRRAYIAIGIPPLPTASQGNARPSSTCPVRGSTACRVALCRPGTGHMR